MTLTGLLTGSLVGLTGMGGGALTMPLLTVVFGVPPLAAVSTDLVAGAVMKPVGAAVHLRRRTAHLPTVGLLCLGSLPCALLGSLLAGRLGAGTGAVLKGVSAAAVLLAAVTLVVRMRLDRGRPASGAAPRIRPVPAVLLGAAAGFVVGTTSVGSGSIVIVCLLLLDRAMSSARLVGTDLVQAVPLVLVAALGHLLHGQVDLGLVGSLLAGSLPGVLAGSLLSARIPDRPVRVLLGGMLAASGAMLAGTGAAVAAALGGLVALAAAAVSSGWFSRGRAPAPAGERIDAGAEGGTG
ncbi:sulfite exporter TauE/SafE family protein [Saccharopolyspora sp. 6V]|uniref:sulfite exporter TauE/SafE family protein n=1 Tax=Saccharopolyspora sp. 6V TaxID=2877239 RepID=UPI001CD1BF8E|nr:sulfite exporter TauE/SafE family protein [Saccharopolyspora sp. 6V]MCA1194346.1 sulfite exporter TauE/SafE family protein [Saccharopolyspora sp. 6V]